MGKVVRGVNGRSLVMVWKYWPERELQEELEKSNPGLLDRLESIVPALDPGGSAQANLFLKSNLIKIMEAFVSGECFSKRAYLKRCLDRLPPDVLHSLTEYLDLDIASGFEAQRDVLLRKKWSRGKFADRFLEYFELPDRFLPTPRQQEVTGELILPASRDEPQHFTTAYKPLKDFQSQIFFTSVEELKSPRSRFIIQMPTGSGKTRTSMELICHFLRNCDDGAIVVWLAHSQELCDQAYQCFTETWVHLANKPVQTVKLWGDAAVPQLAKTSMFWVCGLSKARNWLQNDSQAGRRLSNRLALLVFDEAHMALAPTYKETIERMLGTNSQLIGLSATPGRADDEESEALAGLFFERIIRIEVDEGVSELDLLRSRGVLATIQNDPLITDIKYEVSNRDRKYIEEKFDYPPGFLATIGSDDIRNIEILRKLISEANRGKRILFFACSVAHSRFIAAMLMYMSIRSGHIDGTTDKRTRAASLDSFRNGDIQVICNYGILSTGFDAPKIDVVFISRPTASVVLYSQMIGRGLRGPAIGGTEVCKLVDVKDNIVGFGDQDRVYEYFADYWH